MPQLPQETGGGTLRDSDERKQKVLRLDHIHLEEERFVACKGKGQLALAIEAADIHNRTTSISR